MAATNIPAVGSLTPEAKRTLLGELLKDLTSSQSSVFLELDGTSFHVYRPPANARERARLAMASQTMEEREELRRRAEDRNPRNWLTADEMLQETKAELARQGRE